MILSGTRPIGAAKLPQGVLGRAALEACLTRMDSEFSAETDDPVLWRITVPVGPQLGMRWQSLACLTLLAATIATPGCRTGSDETANPDSSSTDGEWAAEMLPWITQFGVEARRLEGLGAVPFLAADVVVDVRTVGGFSELVAAVVAWGLARFDLVGIPLPDVRSVIFTTYTDYCAEVRGRTIRLPDEDPFAAGHRHRPSTFTRSVLSCESSRSGL